MAKDVNQTIQDSRRAAMSFLEAANERERRRNNRVAPGAAQPADAARELATKSPGGAKRLSAAEEFMKAGRRKEARLANQGGGDIADRIRQMSDDEFGEALRDGTLTPEEVRKAGQYDVDNFILDVWSESDDAEGRPDPTYEEVIADPAGFGASPEDQKMFARYRMAGAGPLSNKQE